MLSRVAHAAPLRLCQERSPGAPHRKVPFHHVVITGLHPNDFVSDFLAVRPAPCTPSTRDPGSLKMPFHIGDGSRH